MGIDRSAAPDRALARLCGERALEREPGRTGTRFELLADAVEDCPMFLLDETGHVRTWNAGAERVVGYTSDGIVGEHVSALYRDEDVEAGVPDRHLREAAAEGYVEEECWRVRPDGSAFRADVTMVALREEGELAGYAVVARDRERHRDHREQARLERTEHLEDLVASVSHDLRTPLAVAEGNVELAVETGDLSRLEATTRALDRATDLLDDLARLAEEGSWVVDPEPVDLHEVATAAWWSVETDEATLDTEGSATVVADPRRLRQLLENLLANSVEHGSTGSRTPSDDAVEHAGSDVAVSVGPLEGEEGLFFVEDDGPGIPEAERTEVFERGYSNDPDGTGFGLAICERIAEAHGWAIDVTDGSDGGARFEVSAVDRE
jgi:PAS domain S-box-containing protein